MASRPATAPATTFNIERTLECPLDIVWRAHSQAAQLQHWWGPTGCKIEVKSLEFRPGGLFHYAMRYSTGAEMWGRFFYREIEPQRRIVWLNSFSNPGGGIARAPFSADCPLEILNAVTFTESAGRTTLSLIAQPFGATPQEETYFTDLKPSLAQGYGGTLDQLAAYLKKFS